MTHTPARTGFRTHDPQPPTGTIAAHRLRAKQTPGRFGGRRQTPPLRKPPHPYKLGMKGALPVLGVS